MACQDVFNIFRTSTESLSKELYRQASLANTWLNVVKRSEYPLGTGVTQSAFTVANVEPTTDDESWSAVTLVSGTPGTGQGACTRTYNQLNSGFKEVTFKPEGFNLQGPVLCKDELSYQFNVDRFLPSYMEELKKRSTRSWEKRYESCYRQIARKWLITSSSAYTISDEFGKYYYTASGAGELPNVTTPTGFAFSGNTGAGTTQGLTQTHLDNIALDLIYAGATNPDENGFISLGDMGPVFTLAIHPAASKKIKLETASTDVRNDLRWGAPSELLKRLGAVSTLYNFRHLPNLTPARFGMSQTVTNCTTSSTLNYITSSTTNAFKTCSPGQLVTGTGITAGTIIISIDRSTNQTAYLGNPTTFAPVNGSGNGTNSLIIGTVVSAAPTGKYDRIPTWREQAVSGGGGYESVLNPFWLLAPIEEATILTPYVFESEIVRPVDRVGDVSWSPTNNMGEFQFVTGGYKWSSSCADPADRLGSHFASFAHAPRPIFPKQGGSIVYYRL